MEQNTGVAFQTNLRRFAPPVAVIVLGFGFLGLGLGNLYLNQRYSQEGKEAIATVTHYTSHQTINPVSSSRADYQFTTPDGKQFTGNQAGYYVQVGERVKIEYLPESPQWNRFAGAGHGREGWNVPMAVGGFLFLAAGVYALMRTLRQS